MFMSMIISVIWEERCLWLAVKEPFIQEIITKKGEGYIVGDGNTMLYLSSVFDSSAVWVPFSSPPIIPFPQFEGKSFRSVSVSNDESLIIGGDGLILMYSNQQWYLSLSDSS